MYINIFNYYDSSVIIIEVSDDIDAEDYVSENYGLDDVSYMTSDTLNLTINPK